MKYTLYSTKSYGNSWVDYQVIEIGAIQTGSIAVVDGTGTGND